MFELNARVADTPRAGGVALSPGVVSHTSGIARWNEEGAFHETES